MRILSLILVAQSIREVVSKKYGKECRDAGFSLFARILEKVSRFYSSKYRDIGAVSACVFGGCVYFARGERVKVIQCVLSGG